MWLIIFVVAICTIFGICIEYIDVFRISKIVLLFKSKVSLTYWHMVKLANGPKMRYEYPLVCFKRKTVNSAHIMLYTCIEITMFNLSCIGLHSKINGNTWLLRILAL